MTSRATKGVRSYRQGDCPAAIAKVSLHGINGCGAAQARRVNLDGAVDEIGIAIRKAAVLIEVVGADVLRGERCGGNGARESLHGEHSPPHSARSYIPCSSRRTSSM